MNIEMHAAPLDLAVTLAFLPHLDSLCHMRHLRRRIHVSYAHLRFVPTVTLWPP